MSRSLSLTVLIPLLAACASEPAIEPSVIVSDSLGSITGGAVPSPDGTQVAWARTVAGKAAVFVSEPDGSNPVQLSSGAWDTGPIWSPDGQWIAYAAESPDFDVMVVAVTGGEPRQVTSGPAFDRPGGWLPDGSGVVVFRTGDGPLHTLVAPLDGGPARRLGPEMDGEQFVAVSPDGKWIAFDLHRGGDAGGSTIWVQELNGGEPRQLTTEGYENAATAYMWSPDSRRLTYTSSRTGTSDIYVLDVATGESRQLTTDIQDDGGARWSPDGQWIAFTSQRGGQTDIWITPADGGAAVRVTNDPAFEGGLQWSGDGGALYFSRSTSDGEILLLPPTGGDPRRVLSWPGYSIFDAEVSPDGHSTIFSSNRSGLTDLWKVSLDGGEPTPFAPSPGASYSQRFSPDGRRVAFVSTRGGGGRPRVWIAPADSGEARRLTASDAEEGTPVWSPDGAWIAFTSNQGGSGGDVWLAPSGGEGTPRQLTHGGLRPGPLEWSRDGTEIYFLAERPGAGSELLAVALRDGTVRTVVGAEAKAGFYQVSPDGRQLAYHSYVGGWAFLSVVPTAGGAPRPLTRETEEVYHFASRWTPDGQGLVVMALDLEGNRDNADLWQVRVDDGSWTRLTHTVDVGEGITGFTPDGQLVVVGRQGRNQVLRVDVSRLLSR